MKKIFCVCFAVLFAGVLIAQINQPCSTCLEEGIIFTNQAQIDSFQINYPNCTEISGDVTISGANITNLNGLIDVTYIGGFLRIYNDPVLTSLTGLEGLNSIGRDLYITHNDTLTTLTGLESLTAIGGNLEFFQNAALINLTGLDNVTFIGGNFIVGNGNFALTNLTGLEGLTSIEEDLQIYSTDALTNLTGLEGVTSIGGDLYISNNDALTSLTGLNSIDVGSITNLYITFNISLSTCETYCLCNYLSNPSGIINIYGNAVGCNSVIELANACGDSIPCLPYGDYYFVSQADIDNFQTAFPNCTALQGNVIINGSDITNLSGLENLTSIGGYLRIYDNNALISLTGLEGLTFIGDYLSIYNNSALTSLIGLEGLNSVGGMLYIGENYALASLTGLDYLTSVGNYLVISNSDALTNLTGLDNVTSIGGYLIINDNDALTSLTGLEGLTSIGDNLNIDGNDALTNLAGLVNVTSIGGYLRLEDNGTLTSLTGLDNIEAGSIQALLLFYNNSLSDCDVQSICDYLAAPNGFILIYNNATGCDSQEEVEAACGVGINETVIQEPEITIYPNPTSFQIIVDLPNSTTQQKNTTLTICKINGQEIIKRQITEQQTVVDINGLNAGIYFVKVVSDDGVMVGKFVKQ